MVLNFTEFCTETARQQHEGSETARQQHEGSLHGSSLNWSLEEPTDPLRGQEKAENAARAGPGLQGPSAVGCGTNCFLAFKTIQNISPFATQTFPRRVGFSF